jgi:hypothetical protein
MFIRNSGIGGKVFRALRTIFVPTREPSPGTIRLFSGPSCGDLIRFLAWLGPSILAAATYPYEFITQDLDYSEAQKPVGRSAGG